MCKWMNDYTNVFVMVLLSYFLFVFGLFILKFFVRFILVYMHSSHLTICMYAGVLVLLLLLFLCYISYLGLFSFLLLWAFPLKAPCMCNHFSNYIHVCIYVSLYVCVWVWIGSFFSSILFNRTHQTRAREWAKIPNDTRIKEL